MGFCTTLAAALLVVCIMGGGAAAQSPVGAPSRSPAPVQTCLVMPFENRSGDPNLDWVRESFVVSFQEALRNGSVQVLGVSQRRRAMQLAGVPAGAVMSQATMIRMAQAAGARWLVTGWFSYDGDRFRTAADVVDLKQEHLVAVASPGGALTDMESLQAGMGARIRQLLDPGSGLKPAGEPLPLAAYENYVRAQIAPAAPQRLQDLLLASRLAPKDARIAYALGAAYYGAKRFIPALQAFDAVPEASPEYPQARFFAALAAARSGNLPQAVSDLQALQRQYPVPAVNEDLALAQQRLANPAARSTAAFNEDFPVASFRQLAAAVASVSAARLHSLPLPDQLAAELRNAGALAKAGALDAAAHDYQQVAAAGAATRQQACAAHLGLARIWLARHNDAQASAQVRAALAADPADAGAQALQQQLGAGRKRLP